MRKKLRSSWQTYQATIKRGHYPIIITVAKLSIQGQHWKLHASTGPISSSYIDVCEHTVNRTYLGLSLSVTRYVNNSQWVSRFANISFSSGDVTQTIRHTLTWRMLMSDVRDWQILMQASPASDHYSNYSASLVTRKMTRRSRPFRTFQ